MTMNVRAGSMLLALFTGIILLFSCMEEKDMRQNTIDQLGQPDETLSGGYGAQQYMIYFYDRADLNRAYIYQKSAPGCGSQGNWYVFDVVYPADLYYDRVTYQPPAVVFSRVKTAPPGVAIVVSAKITDEQYVKESILYCRKVGEENFVPITMAPSDSSRYIGEIPAEKVTTAGVEFYIEASDSGHSTRLPKVTGTYLIAVSEGAVLTYDKPQTFPSAAKPVSGTFRGKWSPVGP